MPYADATWEESGLIEKKWPKQITAFVEREESKRTPSKHCKALKYRPKFHETKQQPDYMTGTDKVFTFFLFITTYININTFLFRI